MSPENNQLVQKGCNPAEADIIQIPPNRGWVCLEGLFRRVLNLFVEMQNPLASSGTAALSSPVHVIEISRIHYLKTPE